MNKFAASKRRILWNWNRPAPPKIEWQREMRKEVAFGADAAFAATRVDEARRILVGPAGLIAST